MTLLSPAMIRDAASNGARKEDTILGTEPLPGSLLWGVPAGRGETARLYSPADGSLILETQLLDAAELSRLTQPANASAVPPGPEEVCRFAARLHRALCQIAPQLREAIRQETAFTSADSEEMLQGALAYVEGFAAHWHRGEAAVALNSGVAYTDGGQARRIMLQAVPWGTVAVILPQNAFLILAVTCLLNALATGNRVILRAPLQSARSAALLAAALIHAEAPAGCVSVALVRARPFVEALYASPQPCLLHYMGSSRHAAQMLGEAWGHRKPLLVDGEGNAWVWVGDDCDPDAAVETLTAGALRYNGQTCTSIVGAMIHPAIFAEVRDRLTARWKTLTAGNPLMGDVTVGPLGDDAQAAWCARQVDESGGTVLCGGRRENNLLWPTLVENPSPDSGLVTEGLFGPGLWIAPGDRDAFAARWPSNRYPLCVGVLSPGADAAWWLARLPNLARLSLNGDPSIEHIYEPWGGYPASGVNPVGDWRNKYRRIVQVDGRA